MHIGVTPWNFDDRSAAGLSEQARLAEQLGFESFWLPESHLTTNAIPDPLMLLAATAAATERIRLATTSYLLPLRNPLLAAEQVAVLDRLSEGRVILGIGRGFAPAMLRAFQVSPAEKRRLFEATLATMKRAWAGEPVDEEGTAGSGDQAAQEAALVLDPLPVQKPHPPLWVAAFGPKALAQAGRLGLPYLASPMETMDSLVENYARHREAALAAGHGQIETVPVMRTVFLTEERGLRTALRERLAQEAARMGRLPAGTQVDDWTIIGDRQLVLDRIAEYEERLKVSHLIVTRLRISGVAPDRIEASIRGLAEILG